MSTFDYGSIMKVVNEHDPIGLLKMEGCPEDEYFPEVEDLLKLMNDGVPITPRGVTILFEHWFYKGCIKPEKAEAISVDLAKLTR